MDLDPDAFRERLVATLHQERIEVRGKPLSANQVDSVRSTLRSFGINAREAIGLSIANDAACLATYLACVIEDVVAVPLPPDVPAAMRRELWAKLHCRYAIEHEEIVPLATEVKRIDWPPDLFWIMHSSGSTGTPKAIPLDIRMIMRNAEDVADFLGWEDGSVHAGSMSLCYTSGLYNAFLLPLLTGGRMVCVPVVDALRFRSYLRLLRERRVDVIWINPTVVSLMNTHAALDLDWKPRFAISCTAPLHRAACKAAETRLGTRVLQSYGLTETLITTIERPGRTIDAEFSSGHAVGFSGALSLQEDGRLCIANGAVMKGYAFVDNNERHFIMPPGSIPEKAFLAQDKARIDENDNLHIIGRCDHVLNIQGTKLQAEALEQTACALTGVDDAIAATVMHPRGEPVLLLLLVGRFDNDEVCSRLTDVHGAFAKPYRIVTYASIPRLPNGKADRIAASRILETAMAEASS